MYQVNTQLPLFAPKKRENLIGKMQNKVTGSSRNVLRVYNEKY